jgi:dynein heavy chain
VAPQIGSTVLLENVPEQLEPALDPILLKQVFRAHGALHIRLGDEVVKYDEDFRYVGH